MRSIFRIGYGCAGSKLAGVIAYCILLTACSGFACNHDKGMESTSADQTVTASVVEISCGHRPGMPLGLPSTEQGTNTTATMTSSFRPHNSTPWS